MELNIEKIVYSPKYNFFREERCLKDTLFVTFGGSIAYGLNTPESDIDIRGVCLNSRQSIVGGGFLQKFDSSNAIYGVDGFEQYTDPNTDTTIYTLNKFIKLIYKCNPNTIEMLGCKPEHYCIFGPSKYLFDNSNVFLSKLAYDSFAGYARGQFQRLKNAVGKDSNGLFSQTVSLADSISRLNKHLEREYDNYKTNMLEIFITDDNGDPIYVNGVKVVAEDISILFNDELKVVDIRGKQFDTDLVQLRFNIHFDKLTTSEFSSVTNEINTTLKEFTKTVGHRNKKKDEYHLCKHAMHLLRLYMMGYDILVKERIITFREDEHDLLMDIKKGNPKWFNGKNFTSNFYNLVSMYDERLSDAVRQTKLPDVPDSKKVIDILDYYNRKIVLNGGCDYV